MTDNPERSDRIVQHSLLVHLTVEHPIQLTEDELIRELASDPGEFGPRDQVQRAIRDLVCIGLLRRNGPFVVPTRAALHAADLYEERHYE